MGGVPINLRGVGQQNRKSVGRPGSTVQRWTTGSRYPTSSLSSFGSFPASISDRVLFIFDRTDIGMRLVARHKTAQRPQTQQSSCSEVGSSRQSSTRERRLLSCGLRRSKAASANRIWRAWRQSVASYRLRRSSAKLGRLARRKKQRASSTVVSSVGSTDFEPELGTFVAFVTPSDTGSRS